MASLSHQDTTHDTRLLQRMACDGANVIKTSPITRARRLNRDAEDTRPSTSPDYTGHRSIDLGERLRALAAAMCCIAGAPISFDLEIGLPRSRVRLDPYEFDSAMLALVADAASAGARNIELRMHKVGARIWILAHDDGRTRPPALVAVRHLARRAHGQVLVRTSPSTGNAVALILPAVLSVCTADTTAPRWSIMLKHKEKSHEEDRQPVAA